MTTNEENNNKGSSRIPQAKAGTTGPSREVPEQDAIPPCAGVPGQENTRENRPKNTGNPRQKPRLVERKTELRGQSIAPTRTKKNTLRRRTEEDLMLPEPEIPFYKAEAAMRDLVCSLMERQDRMNEALFLRIGDLEYRIEDLEVENEELKEERLP